MEKVNGSPLKHHSVTLMKVIILMIRSKVMEYSNGHQEIYIKENIKMMKEMAMEK